MNSRDEGQQFAAFRQIWPKASRRCNPFAAFVSYLVIADSTKVNPPLTAVSNNSISEQPPWRQQDAVTS